VDKKRCSNLSFIKKMKDHRQIGKKPFHLNKKQNIIYLKSVFPSR